MLDEIKRGVLFTIVTMVLSGGAYHVALWAVGQVVFSSQAEGSLLRREDGTVIGSRLIAQAFMMPDYFHPRPSGVPRSVPRVRELGRDYRYPCAAVRSAPRRETFQISPQLAQRQ